MPILDEEDQLDAVPSEEIKGYLRSKFYEDPKATRRAEDEAARLRLMSAISSGLDKVTAGVTGSMPDQAFNKSMQDEAAGIIRKDQMQQERVRNYLKEAANSQARQASLDIQNKKLDAYLKEQERNARLAQQKESKELMPGQKALDQSFAKDYSDYVAQGGSAAQASHMKSIDSVKEWLNKPGQQTNKSIVGSLPDAGRALFDSEGLGKQQEVEDAVMSSLRQTLGSQFTEREGRKILAVSYDPRLSDEQNIAKLSKLQTKLQLMAQSKADAAKYFEENGSLKGYQGKIYTVDDFLTDEKVPSSTEAPPPGATQRRKRQDGTWEYR